MRVCWSETDLILGGTRKRTHVAGLRRILRNEVIVGYHL